MEKSKIPHNLIGDPGRLRQILINLISNAIKFTEKGEIQISCNLLKCSEDQYQLHFEIIDSGIGMSGEVTQQLFQRTFVRPPELNTISGCVIKLIERRLKFG